MRMKIKLMPFQFVRFVFVFFALFWVFFSSADLKYSQTSALSRGSREQKAAAKRLDVQEKAVLNWPDKKNKKKYKRGWRAWQGNN